jgi:SAM-dependent methyltransferase
MALSGPVGITDPELRLLGDVKGKRVLDLGCGTGEAAITFAKHGAVVIAVDGSVDRLARARARAEEDEVRVEWHHADLAELAFLRADSVDVAYSSFAVGSVDDVARLFRQVQRVLRPHAAFVFSYEHPFSLCVGAGGTVERSYFDHQPVTATRDGEAVVLHPRTVSEVFVELGRAGFRVDVLAEPAPNQGVRLPTTIVWRARKEGA